MMLGLEKSNLSGRLLRDRTWLWRHMSGRDKEDSGLQRHMETSLSRCDGYMLCLHTGDFVHMGIMLMKYHMTHSYSGLLHLQGQFGRCSSFVSVAVIKIKQNKKKPPKTKQNPKQKSQPKNPKQKPKTNKQTPQSNKTPLCSSFLSDSMITTQRRV